jgi:hypothetical protein
MRVLSMAGAWQGQDFTAKTPSLAEEVVHA